jgi:hypothetical protein
MATAITINAVAGGYLRVPLTWPAVAVQLDIVPAPGGGVVKAWTLYRPRGSTAVLTNPAIQNPLFTPDVEGTYRLALTLDGVPDDGAVCDVPYVKICQRVPAQGETTQASASEGWSIGPADAGVNDLMKFIIDNGWQGSLVVCRAAAPLALYQAVASTSRYILKSGLPGQELIPNVVLADATSLLNAASCMGVVVKKLSPGGGGILLGEYCLVQMTGPVLYGINTAAGGVGDPVFLSDTPGLVSLTPGAVLSVIGTVVTVGAFGGVMLRPGTAGIFQHMMTSGAAVTAGMIVTETGFPFDATNIVHMQQYAGIAAATVGGAGIDFPVWSPSTLFPIPDVLGGPWSLVGVALYANPAVPGGMVEFAGLPAAGPYGRLQVATCADDVTMIRPVDREPLWIPA